MIEINPMLRIRKTPTSNIMTIKLIMRIHLHEPILESVIVNIGVRDSSKHIFLFNQVRVDYIKDREPQQHH